MGDAFGVAAADITWRIEGENHRLTTLFKLELVETGTDAISDLPEYN